MVKKWNYKIDIKQHLSEDTSNEAIKKAAKGVVSELQKLPENLDDIDIVFVIAEFQNMIEDTVEDEDNEWFLDEFNYTLDRLYDWADTNRVWMGL